MPIYRDLHQNPESSLQEHRSTKIMADAARAAGFAVTEGVGKTGVVAVLKNGAGRPMPARPAHLTRGR